ncbi:chitin synthase I [Apiospora arundinis]
MWDAPKATSIWSELVDKRKEQIAITCDGSEPSHVAPIAAAQQDFTRREFGEWDASARAWLAVADRLKEAQHRNMEDILMIRALPLANDNSRVSVNDFSLVCLGSLFSAWQGEHFDAMYDQEEGAKFIVALWNSIENAASSCIETPESTNTSARDLVSAQDSWLRMLLDASRELLEGNDQSRRRARHLTSLGVRRGASFLLSEETRLLPFFGLLDLNTWAAFAPRNSDRALIHFREIYQLVNDKVKFSDAILRYSESSTGHHELAALSPISTGTKRDYKGGNRSVRHHARWIRKGTNRSHDTRCFCVGKCEADCICRRNKAPCHDLCGAPHIECDNLRQAVITSLGEDCWEYDSLDISLDLDGLYLEWTNKAMNQVGTKRTAEGAQASSDVPGQGSNLSMDEIMTSFDSQVADYENWYKSRTHRYEYLFGNDHMAAYVRSEEIAEANEDVALGFSSEISTSITLQGLMSMLLSRKLDGTKLVEQILYNLQVTEQSSLSDPPFVQSETSSPVQSDTQPNQFARSMQVLCTISLLFSFLPGAMVSLEVVHQRLYASPWLPAQDVEESSVMQLLTPARLTRPQAFSCIAMLETGSLHITPDELHNVMALSIGNSIYAAASLFTDPWEARENYELRRIIGNVGRAGVSMLIPPMNPILKKGGVNSWAAINHERFTSESRCIDHFTQTSLHLSFTGYEQPVASSVIHGAQDIEACFLEAVVSIFDSGRKIGDLDIIRGLGSSKIARVPESRCWHQGSRRRGRPKWTSVDTWDELMEMPSGRTCIVRAYGNALSRIAATVVCVQKDVDQLYILSPGDVCYTCVVGQAGSGGSAEGGVKVIIC